LFFREIRDLRGLALWTIISMDVFAGGACAVGEDILGAPITS
jgi:hypothetical protein